MSEEKMTAEQAWAEVDRLDRESRAACLAAVKAEDEAKRLRREANRIMDQWSDADDAAEAIGPRPVKAPSVCELCDGKGYTIENVDIGAIAVLKSVPCCVAPVKVPS